MILDSQLQFSVASPGDNLTGVGPGTANSGNVLDLHMAGIPVLSNNQGARDLGIGDDPALKLLVQVGTAFTSGGAATLSVALQGSPDNGSGGAAGFTTWWISPAYALATLAVAGARLLDMDVPRPPAGIAIPRFLRLLYTVGTTTFTAGTVQGFIVIDRADQVYNATANATWGGYPAGITVAN